MAQQVLPQYQEAIRDGRQPLVELDPRRALGAVGGWRPSGPVGARAIPSERVDSVKLRDPEAWQQFEVANQDEYGGAVVSYAKRWAEFMEAAMAAGESLEACAERTSHEADTEGITGFMYGAAVATLAQTWEHGEALRRWHNLRYQVKDEGERANREGGVLNPAVLVIDGLAGGDA